MVRSSAWSGIRENIAASGASDAGALRCAPFGVPVVPEVRMMNRASSAGGSTSD
jgi:hypothetical protein